MEYGREFKRRSGAWGPRNLGGGRQHVRQKHAPRSVGCALLRPPESLEEAGGGGQSVAVRREVAVRRDEGRQVGGAPAKVDDGSGGQSQRRGTTTHPVRRGYDALHRRGRRHVRRPQQEGGQVRRVMGQQHAWRRHAARRPSGRVRRAATCRAALCHASRRGCPARRHRPALT
eukprot:scaffold24174_cov127-Isochrysis_galbana.AAC.4